VARPRRVLIVARDFPPEGGAPSIRIAKLVKYLPSFGWLPEVVTAPPDHVWVRDDTLLGDIGAAIEVHRVPRLLSATIPPQVTARRARGEVRAGMMQRLAGFAMIPDRSILWAVPAARAVRSLRPHFDALLTSAPPFSTHLVGLLAGQIKAPWFVDYRDNWTTNPDYRGATPMRPLYRALERAVLGHATEALTVSAAATAELRSLNAAIPVTVAPNGFDADDLPRRDDEVSTSFRFVYTGSMRDTRDPGSLLAALAHHIDRTPGFGEALELTLVGIIPDSVLAAAHRMIGPDRVSWKGFVPHKVALEHAAEAAVLVAITSEAEAGSSAMTSKLTEYLALGRPILYVAPPGPGSDLVVRRDAREVAPPDDAPAAIAAVGRLFQRWKGRRPQRVPLESLEAYSRRETARIVASRLDVAWRNRQ
jgi:glycosyltransferase involved in cell wall biosynthesis